MKLHLILPASAALFLAASCTPYVEPPPPAPVDPAANKQPTEEEKKKAAEAREKKKKEADELANKEKTTEGDTVGPDAGGTTNPDATPPKKPEEKKPIPTAREVPGRPGFVFSPFNNKIIDIRDENGVRRASGKIMSDPTYQASEKKHFRIP